MGKFSSTIKILVPPIAAFFLSGISTQGSFIEMASSLAGVSLLIPLVTEFFKLKLNLEHKLIWGIKAPRFVSWISGILLSFVSYYAGWGYFGELTAWYMPLISGLGAGLIANGYFTLEFVQTLLKVIFDNLRKNNEQVEEDVIEEPQVIEEDTRDSKVIEE